MARPPVPDYNFTAAQLQQYIDRFATAQAGSYSIVLVPDRLDRRYNLVFQKQNGYKFRVRVRHPDNPSQMSSIWDVWLVLRKQLFSGSQVPDAISEVVESALRDGDGTVMVTIADYGAAKAFFHEGERWP